MKLSCVLSDLGVCPKGTHHVQILEMNGDSYRLKRKQDTQKRLLAAVGCVEFAPVFYLLRLLFIGTLPRLLKLQ